MPIDRTQELLDRIQLRLDQSFVGISTVVSDLPAPDLADLINELTLVEAATVITMLPIPRAVEVMGQPTLRRRAGILEHLEPNRATQVLEGLAADERTAIVRQLGERVRRKLLPTLSDESRAEVQRLLQYPAKSAGGIMTTEFVGLDPAMTVGDALKHIRAVAREKEAIYSCYVLEPKTGALLGAVSLRDLVMAELAQPVAAVMRKKPVTVAALDHQEPVAKKIAKYNLLAVPVLETGRTRGRLRHRGRRHGRAGGRGHRGHPAPGRRGAGGPGRALCVHAILGLIRKRAGWLLILFLGEMLTATAMGRFEDEIARAVVLALFVPLIISSGGNSGSQAASLIIRALAVGELRIRDWWRVMRREVLAGLVLGGILGVVGFLRITLWSLVSPTTYGPHWPLVAITVWVSLIGVVLWGTFAGSMLPLAPQAPGPGSRRILGAVRRDARRRHRDRHLLRGGLAGASRYAPVMPWGLRRQIARESSGSEDPRQVVAAIGSGERHVPAAGPDHDVPARDTHLHAAEARGPGRRYVAQAVLVRQLTDDLVGGAPEAAELADHEGGASGHRRVAGQYVRAFRGRAASRPVREVLGRRVVQR